MNPSYGKLVNGAIIHAPTSLNTPSGLIMNPKRLSYLQAGWKFLDLQPPVDPPPEGKEYRISGYTETATDIRPIFKLVPVVSPPRTFSKLRLINALMSRSLWPAVRDWLDATGYYDLFVAQPLAAPSGFALRAQATRPLRGGCIAQDFREDHPQFAAALTAARTRFSLPESEIAALLAESAAD